VDQVLRLRPGHSVVSCLNPGGRRPRPEYRGSLPGSYLLESMIQTCGLLAPEPDPARGAPPQGMVVALDRVRWFGSAPGRERIVIRCRLLRQMGPFLRCRCVARREEGDLLASGEVTLRIDPGTAPELV
jgi:3-hydroxymyristoyl/3-hydroxydecanoyl-(acyl carrier protein) dehydratase